jgi:hypothetical protein
MFRLRETGIFLYESDELGAREIPFHSNEILTMPSGRTQESPICLRSPDVIFYQYNGFVKDFRLYNIQRTYDDLLSSVKRQKFSSSDRVFKLFHITSDGPQLINPQTQISDVNKIAGMGSSLKFPVVVKRTDIVRISCGERLYDLTVSDCSCYGDIAKLVLTRIYALQIRSNFSTQNRKSLITTLDCQNMSMETSSSFCMVVRWLGRCC